ncbi:MAG: 50S ribosomal protein L4 [Candidatus Eisenbacteria bacterium]|nr:50S ribosomal protein L4 [Candidatus Eisenbacteria bacterium]
MANTVPVHTRGGEKRGEVALPERLFGIEPNEHVMYEAVRTYLANQRRGTVKTKGRSDVSGGGRKPWRQKGTGRARVGSSRISQWRGGGITFGPKPRDHGMRLPKKIRRLALKSALSAKAADDAVRMVEDFELERVSTKDVATMLGALGVGDGFALLVVKEADEKLLLSSRNIPNLEVLRARDITTYYLLRADVVIMTEGALGVVEEVFGE